MPASRAVSEMYRRIVDPSAIALASAHGRKEYPRVYMSESARTPDIVERIERNARDMLGMVERVLDFSRLTAGAVEIHPKPVEAWCDADQALTPGEFATLMVQLRAVARAIGREL